MKNNWQFNEWLAIPLAVGIISGLFVFAYQGKISAEALLAMMGPILTLVVQYYYRKRPNGDGA